MRFISNQTMARAAMTVLLVGAVVACSSTYNNAPFPPNFTPEPTSQSITTSTTATTTIPTLTISGYTIAGTLPIANAAVSVTEVASVAAPSGVTPLARRRMSADPNTDLIYVTLTAASTVTLNGSPAFTFTSSQIVSGTTYYLGAYINGAWVAPAIGPATASGTSVTFASTATPVTLTTTGVTLVLYATSATPTPTPTPTPVASPASLAFDAASPSPQTFNVSENGYGGAFSASMTCTLNPVSQSPVSNAYVAQFSAGGTTASVTPSSAGGNATFTVDGGAETGSCPVSVSDTNGNKVAISVTVSSSSVTISRTHRH